ncbi:hypothetical protein [Paraeggerthella sp.]|uniref:hypothetical protein n=1 Tax=Paraeggerthella sp. TaxID=2897350 RepID=UPI0035283CF2
MDIVVSTQDEGLFVMGETLSGTFYVDAPEIRQGRRHPHIAEQRGFRQGHRGPVNNSFLLYAMRGRVLVRLPEGSLLPLPFSCAPSATGNTPLAFAPRQRAFLMECRSPSKKQPGYAWYAHKAPRFIRN